MNDPCANFKNLIPRSLMGETNGAEEKALESHLPDCPPCAAYREQILQTLQQLQSMNDVAVPRHFFLYPQANRTSVTNLFSRLSPAWKATLAACMTMILLLTGFLADRVRWDFNEGVLALSFGPSTTPGVHASYPVDAQAFKAELVQLVEGKLRQEHLRWIQAIREDLSEFSAALTEEQQGMLQARLQRSEAQVDQQMAVTQTMLQEQTDRSLKNLYAILRAERQRDLSVLTDRLDRMAEHGTARENEIDNVLATLIELAELRN